jgi:hypothetical protein
MSAIGACGWESFRLGVRYGRLRLKELSAGRRLTMNKTLSLRHEIITVISRPSYLFAIFGIPIINVDLVAGQLSRWLHKT